MSITLRCSASILAVVCLLTLVGRAEEWPQFRGPTGQGVSAASDVPISWDAESNVAWKIEIPGNGWSSPVVSQRRIFVTAAVPEGDEQVSSEGKFSKKVATPYALRTICMDYDTGDVLWNVEISKVPAETSIHPKNSHASSTPVVTHDRVYVHFGTYGTAALDLNGQVLWSKQIDYKPVHGSGGSPVIFEDLLIFNCDGAMSPFVLALDTATGEARWRTPRPPYDGLTFSFSTPLVIEADGKPQVVSAGSHAACGYDPRTGEQLWVVRYPNKWSVVPRPVFANGLVLICTGYEGPAELLAIRPDGEGDITETHVEWRAKKFVPHNPSPLVSDESIYMVDDDGIASCRDLTTGELRWSKRIGGNYSSSPVLAERRIYFLSGDGTCIIAQAASRFEQLAKNQLNERTFASIVPLDRSLLIRTENNLYRIGK